MYISKLSLSRRTFLRGAGAAIALPLLDAMMPALTPYAKAAAAPRTRFGCIYIPNGAIVDEFFPKSFGTNWEFTPILKPLEPFKDRLVVVKNLTRSHPGSQVGDHAVSVGGYLTGVWPKRTEAEDVFANTTIDQVVAKQIGQGAPIGVPDSFEEHVGLMYDLVAAAYQADVTRVFTFMLSRELSQRTYNNLGVSEQHHTVSHHGNDPDKIAKNVKINTYHMQLFAKFIAKLQATEDGDGTLLDHAMIFSGGGMGNPNGHLTDPLPVIALGGGRGKGYRHIELPARTPVGDLWLSVAHKFGDHMKQFGDGDAPIEVFS